MAMRPWLTPEELRDYTEFEGVRSRKNKKLEIDISRAEEYIIRYTNNRFDNMEDYPLIPSSVKTAVLLIAEAYSQNAKESTKKLKSETFDDYSYTLADNSVDLSVLDLPSLLDDYLVAKDKGSIKMKLRKL